MRYTRNRQMAKFDYSWRCVTCKKIEGYWTRTNPYLDPTFKWHREEGCISFLEDIFGRTFVTEVTIHKKEPMKFF